MHVMLDGFGDRDRDALLLEARAAGVIVEGSDRYELADRSAGDAARQLVGLAVTGSAAATVTHLEVVDLTGPFGPFVYVVPFQSSRALSGIYHLRLAGGLAQPAVYIRRLFGGRWHANDDKAVLDRLERTSGLKAALKALPFKKHTTIGSIDLDWTVQVSALGDGTSHVAIQAGSRNLDVHTQLLDAVVEVARALTPALTDSVGERQGFYFTPPYLDLVYERL